MTNQTQDPTPDQEKMHEMQGEIDYLKEQISDAIVLLRDALHPPTSIDSLDAFQDSICNWIAQNSAH
jgi:hypothetical protein